MSSVCVIRIHKTTEKHTIKYNLHNLLYELNIVWDSMCVCVCECTEQNESDEESAIGFADDTQKTANGGKGKRQKTQ